MRSNIVHLIVALFLILAFPAATPGEEIDPVATPSEREVEKKCLDCHNNPALYGSRRTGELRSVHVDTQKYRASVHYEKYSCLTCHPGATPDHHPREGVVIRACGSCHDHEDELADFEKSLHGIELAGGDADGPDCFSCHSNHYTRKKDDPESAIHRCRIRTTCGACHEEEAGETGSSSWWAGGRISAHGKSDLSESYSTRDCKRCHFGRDTHLDHGAGEAPACAACHRRNGPSEGDGPFLGAVHLASPSSHGETLSLVRAAGLALSLTAFLLLAIPAGVFIVRRRRAAPGEKKEGMEEEATS